jgi:hypothetical protein
LIVIAVATIRPTIVSAVIRRRSQQQPSSKP